MLQSHFPRRQTISTVILTCGVVLGLVLCYFVAIPFVPAIVGSFTLSVIFVPLDTRIRKTVGSVGVSAAATVTVVALVVVIPAFVVIGTLLNEADRSAALIGSLIDSQTWSHAMESRPRLAPLLRLINERFDVPDLVKASTSWLAGWSGAFVQGSFSGTLSLMLTFYFLFYLLRDREAIRAAVEEALPLSETEFSRLAWGASYNFGPHHLFRFSDIGGNIEKPDFAVRPNSYPTRSLSRNFAGIEALTVRTKLCRQSRPQSQTSSFSRRL